MVGAERRDPSRGPDCDGRSGRAGSRGACATAPGREPARVGSFGGSIDGGFVNPVPFDLLKGHADIIAAIDVCAGPQQSRGHVPSMIEAIIGSNQITMRSVMSEKLKSAAPDILIRPDIGQFKVLDFYKIDDIFAASEAAKDEFKRACEAAIVAREIR